MLSSLLFLEIIIDVGPGHERRYLECLTNNPKSVISGLVWRYALIQIFLRQDSLLLNVVLLQEYYHIIFRFNFLLLGGLPVFGVK